MSEFILRAGESRISVLSSLIHFLQNLGKDSEWLVAVKPYKRSRSDAQNAGLWGVAYKTIEEATGNEAEDLHCFFCGEVFGWKETLVMGKKKLKPRRTTTRGEDGKRDVLPWDAFYDFYAFVQRRAAEGGVFVPDPDPNWRDAK